MFLVGCMNVDTDGHNKFINRKNKTYIPSPSEEGNQNNGQNENPSEIFNPIDETGDTSSDENDDSDEVGKDYFTNADDIPLSERYIFNHKKGMCLNQHNEAGRNIGYLINCGDVSGLTVDHEDLRDKGLYGISFMDTFITYSMIRLEDLVDYEALLNEGTLIDGFDNLFHDVSKLYAQRYQVQLDKINELTKKIRQKMDLQEKFIKKLENANNQNQADSFERKIAELQDEINALREELLFEDSKKIRMKDYSIKYGLLE